MDNELIKQMADEKEVFWLNPNLTNNLSKDILAADIINASARLERFAPYIKSVFPETEENNGIIESPLKEISKTKEFLFQEATIKPCGSLMLKCDNFLPVSGSVKARGGIYEVLWFAEKLAIENGLIKESDDYLVFKEEKIKKFFSNHSLAVGSTGNLGLSIGIMGVQLGFKVSVHMSFDAKQWKKDLLRKKGAEVIEYDGDYQKAVEEGRKKASNNKFCHFVDDENSKTLFIGYATAAKRLQKQLKQQNITVDEDHRLFVYLPCGVGGGPGGIAFGLKQIYGENVHCFFAEPVQSPCMLLGMLTGKHDQICVQDIGLSGKTIADGLAVGRPSKFVGKIMENLLDGIFTVSEQRMKRYVREIYLQENMFLEPSATAGLLGYNFLFQQTKYLSQFSCLKNSTHIVWATGGGMVQKSEQDKYIL